jgi:alpha-ketoglutarate-dependent taurine dioxygenase
LDTAKRFHTDKCSSAPHRATFLYGIEIPSEGGHTQFSSMYAAYKKAGRLKRQLAGAVSGASNGVGRRIGITAARVRITRQPIFVTNPGSSRKALYVGQNLCGSSGP